MTRRRAVRPLYGAAVVVPTIAVLSAVLLAGCASTMSREDLAVEYFNIGSAYFELGEIDKSATYLSRALDLSPQLARASYNLARVSVAQGKYDRAFELLGLLLAEDPANSLVMETFAYAHYLAGDAEDAGRWYDRALEVNPTGLDLLQNRAAVAMELGEHARAAAFLERALRLSDDRPQLRLRLAEARLAEQQYEPALEAYRTYFLRVSAPAPEARLGYATALEAEEFYADALAEIDAVIAGEVDQRLAARAQFTRGRLLILYAGEADTGVEAIATAVRLGFNEPEDFDLLLAEVPDEVARRLSDILSASGLVEPETEAEPQPETQPDVDEDPGAE